MGRVVQLDTPLVAQYCLRVVVVLLCLLWHSFQRNRQHLFWILTVQPKKLFCQVLGWLNCRVIVVVAIMLMTDNGTTKPVLQSNLKFV